MNICARVICLYCIATFFYTQSNAQVVQSKDTLKSKTLDSVIKSTYFYNAKAKYLADVVGVNIYSGKKTNVISLDPSRANLAQNVT